MLGSPLFKNGNPRKAYTQPKRFLSRPDAPQGEREEWADFFRKNKGQAMRGLLVGEKSIVYSSFTQTFVYPRLSLRKVIKETSEYPDAENGGIEKRLVLHFDGCELYTGERGHKIRSTERQIERWIAYIHGCCADISVEYFTLLYNTRHYHKKSK